MGLESYIQIGVTIAAIALATGFLNLRINDVKEHLRRLEERVSRLEERVERLDKRLTDHEILCAERHKEKQDV